MRSFSQLLDALVYTRGRNAKLKLVGDYLKSTPDPDRGWAMAALTRDLDLPGVKPAAIKAITEERVDPVLFAMSRDGLLPRGFAHVNPKSGTPVFITVTIGTLVAIVASLTPIGKLEEMVNIGTLFAFVLVAVGTWVLRKQQPDLPRSFVVKGLPIVATLAVVACLWLMINLAVETWLRFIGWMVLGVLIYVFYSRRNSVLGKRERGEDSSVDGPARV